MTRSELLFVIHSVLTEKMALPHVGQFSEQARLNEQLGLDSVLMLELLVHLELEHGLALPEEVALQKHDGTVGTLVDFLLRQAESAPLVAGGGR